MKSSTMVWCLLAGAAITAAGAYFLSAPGMPQSARAHTDTPALAPTAALPHAFVPAIDSTTTPPPARPAPALAAGQVNQANQVNEHWSAHSLATTLKRSSSYQAFVQQALRNPEKGGVLYAQNVVFGCTQANDALQVANFKNEAKRAAILADFQAHCDITLQQFNALLLAQPGIQERDPLYSMLGELGSRQAENRRKALAQALKTQDPVVLFETPALAFLRRVPAGAEGGGEKVFLYFNGQWLNEAEAAPFRYAQKLAACDFGLPCQQNDVWLANLCVSANECATSRQEYMTRFVYPHQPAWQIKIEQYRHAIRQAVQAQSVAAFIPSS